MMLHWFRTSSVARVDVAVRRPGGVMIWHRGIETDALPLGFLGAENLRRGEIYVRPARGSAWPLVFLDDVVPARACAVAAKYRALVVETSRVGGAHVWLACGRALDERDRARAQRWLARLVDADPASTSGEHLGRLAGFKNWKRGGVWVNILARSNRARPWDPIVALTDRSTLRRVGPFAPRSSPVTDRSHDASASGREWGWVCSMLEQGRDPHAVHRRLIERAQDRRGRDTERYASRTVSSALRRIERRTTPRRR
jgi:hypothetical protein